MAAAARSGPRANGAVVCRPPVAMSTSFSPNPNKPSSQLRRESMPDAVRVKLEKALQEGEAFLDLSNCDISVLPQSVSELTAIKELHLYNNRLTSLPESIGSNVHIVKLSLSENQVRRATDAVAVSRPAASPERAWPVLRVECANAAGLVAG